ncbi:MAG: NAD(P)/FAD-dependent oxidoreductase [Sulfurimonas sp.]|nr:NAD(P)/FAD-dependent oxidoreductase [Sulfurimonas sp.]
MELGKAGLKTLLVEITKEKIGGVCLNEGCIPTKNYLESVNFVSRASYFQECGLMLEFQGFNLEKLRDKTTALKNEIRTGILWLLEQSKVELLYGSAAFVDAHTLEVSGESISFKKCIIATGSKSRELPQLPFDGKRIISSSDLFELKRMPKSITIVGIGAIGCEAATFFNAFGVEVTLIGRSTQLLPQEDEDISKALLRAFKKRNIKVITSAVISKAEIYEEGVKLFTEAQEEIECELVLSVTGRTPYTQGLHLENTGVKQDAEGFIEITPSFVSTNNHIYAVGDCIATPAYAHTAYAEAKIVAYNIINSEDKSNFSISPNAVFTNPAVASCGMKEKDAKKSEVEVKKAFFKQSSKAKIEGDDSGFAKLIVDVKSGVILGASIVGVGATEIIHELLLAIEKRVTLKELRELIHIHPTLSEIVSYL